MERYSLTVTPKSRKNVKFTIWDNETGEQEDEKIYDMSSINIKNTVEYWNERCKSLNDEYENRIR